MRVWSANLSQNKYTCIYGNMRARAHVCVYVYLYSIYKHMIHAQNLYSPAAITSTTNEKTTAFAWQHKSDRAIASICIGDISMCPPMKRFRRCDGALECQWQELKNKFPSQPNDYVRIKSKREKKATNNTFLAIWNTKCNAQISYIYSCFFLSSFPSDFAIGKCGNKLP